MIWNLDAREAVSQLDDASVQLVWTDPPFGTGATQRLRSTTGTDFAYRDLPPSEARALVCEVFDLVAPKLTPSAVVAICLDHRVVHETKVALDRVGPYIFAGEIIYHFELGGVSKSWWSNKHNTVLLYALGSPKFYLDRVPTVPRQAPRNGYASAERRVNSVWSITMSPTDPQRTGYPNQKPLKLVEPFVAVHTDASDLVFDPFSGSGTTGVAAKNLGRRYALNDINPEAVDVMRRRGL